MSNGQQAMTLTLRYMTLDDIPEVISIDRQAFSTPWTARSYTYEVHESSHSYMLVLEHSTPQAAPPRGLRGWWQRIRANGSAPAPAAHTILAYGGLWNILDEAHVSTIAVRADQRGNGYGELVLAAMVQRALNLTAEYVVLEVRVSNVVAQNLYLKHGFESVAVKRSYYRDDNEDAYDMRLMLTDAVRAEYPARYQTILQKHQAVDVYTTTPHPRESGVGSR